MLADSLELNRHRMVALLRELTTEEGLHPSCLDGVRLSRAERSIPRQPKLYEPSVYIVASGSKRGFIGTREFTYDRNNYLVLSVPLPFECETHAGDGEPMFGMSIRMDLSVIAELAAKLQFVAEPSGDDERCIDATPLHLRMSNAAVRLLECLHDKREAAVLGPGIVREIAYHALCGPRGVSLHAMLGRSGAATQIYPILRRLHARYAEPLQISSLAREAGMSVSALHHSFKAVTASSPLQYVKSIRLHQAKRLIVHDGLGAAAAASRVGYESASQFSREYKRFFGEPPTGHARQIRLTA